MQIQLCEKILDKVRKLGASLAGFADVEQLKDAPSFQKVGTVRLHSPPRAVLVLALDHHPDEPELDWWDNAPGGTPGNRNLIKISEELKAWLEKELEIRAYPISYHIENGGIFLKDAAVLAGLGCIGKNNLLITPRFGPCVRLRGLFLEMVPPPPPTATADQNFAPCADCKMPCRTQCPRDAFASGGYKRDACESQMESDIQNRVQLPIPGVGISSRVYIKYCRVCELVCPVGSKEQ